MIEIRIETFKEPKYFIAKPLFYGDGDHVDA